MIEVFEINDTVKAKMASQLFFNPMNPTWTHTLICPCLLYRPDLIRLINTKLRECPSYT